MKRVAIFFNDDGALSGGGCARDHLAVEGVMYAVRGIEGALKELGYDVVTVSAPSDPAVFLDALARARADVVVNLVESLRGESRFEAAAAALYELSGVPYTGSSGEALGLALDKPRTQALLRGLGVPVPKGQTFFSDRERLDPSLCFPLIVKPAREDASHGICLKSVCHDEAELRIQVARMLLDYGYAALVEEFHTGREFTVAVLGNGATATALPLREIDYTGFPDGAPRVVTYDAKWTEETQEFSGTTPRVAVDVSAALAERLKTSAVQAFRAIGLRDYGRIDLRLDATGTPLVLDVNANPDLSPTCGMAAAALASSIPYQTLIARIVEAAIARDHRPKRTPRPSPVAPPSRRGVVRSLRREDRPAIERVLRATEAFTEEEVRVALELVDDGLVRGQTDYDFVVLDQAPQGVIGYACFGPTPLTDGIYDLYWIAVDPTAQGLGHGACLFQAAETAMRSRGGRKLLIETASKPEYAKTRRFYDKIGLVEIARVKDFYRAGDDKIIYARPDEAASNA